MAVLGQSKAYGQRQENHSHTKRQSYKNGSGKQSSCLNTLTCLQCNNLERDLYHRQSTSKANKNHIK